MNDFEYKTAVDAFKAVLASQPAVINSVGNGEDAGKKLAQTAWGFIDEFQRQYQQKVGK